MTRTTSWYAISSIRHLKTVQDGSRVDGKLRKTTVTQKEALDSLDFGSVNSEEEVDLDRLFVQTQDFRSFLDPKIWVILGVVGHEVLGTRPGLR
ncbi:hypothetical protein KXR73_09825 [Micrococcus luteus]|uniref:hypothetical protein n=1 Tax=Micrococcus luteus TaxID=1270 RepID=UPI003F155BFF